MKIFEIILPADLDVIRDQLLRKVLMAMTKIAPNKFKQQSGASYTKKLWTSGYITVRPLKHGVEVELDAKKYFEKSRIYITKDNEDKFEKDVVLRAFDELKRSIGEDAIWDARPLWHTDAFWTIIAWFKFKPTDDIWKSASLK